jgi:hypothetical protein
MKFAEPTELRRKSGVWGTRPFWWGGGPQISPLRFAPVEMTILLGFEIRLRSQSRGHCRSLGYAPNEQTKSVVPHLRRSTACLWTQPFRAGLIFGAGPLGLDCKHRFPMFIPPLT